jgi:hypothetical protein
MKQREEKASPSAWPEGLLSYVDSNTGQSYFSIKRFLSDWAKIL